MTGTLGNPSTALLYSLIYFVTASSGAVDFTIRIGMPQLELASDASAVIATSGSAVTVPNSSTVYSITSAPSYLVLQSNSSSVDDFYNGYALEITGGTGAGQDHQRIVDYDGATKTAYVSGKWITTPDSTSTYRINNRAA